MSIHPVVFTEKTKFILIKEYIFLAEKAQHHVSITIAVLELGEAGREPFPFCLYQSISY